MSQHDEITRDEARALIAKHGIVALEREVGKRPNNTEYELDHNQYFRLGNGRLLWRVDSDEGHCETWELVVETIDSMATDAPREITAGA